MEAMSATDINQEKIMKTIYTPCTAFGGCEYRVTSDGNICNLQERSPTAARFTTRATIPRAEFDAALAEMGSRPELVARLIEKANRE